MSRLFRVIDAATLDVAYPVTLPGGRETTATTPRRAIQVAPVDDAHDTFRLLLEDDEQFAVGDEVQLVLRRKG